MTKLFVMACWLAVTPLLRAADSTVEARVKAIRAESAAIEQELKSYREVKRDLPDESAEGGELTAWFKGPALRKLSARFFGETGQALEEYYFARDVLIFVLRVESHYTRPMSGVTKSKTEQRFYFADGKLIRWLNQDNKDVTNDAAAGERERELVASAKKYAALARP